MAPKPLPPHLRLIEPAIRPESIDRSVFQRTEWQQTLFASTLPNLLAFVFVDSVNESDFLSLILNSKPKFILDLRVVPHFDIGNLNRRLVFSVFDQVNARYYDIAGKLGVSSPRDSKLNPGVLIDYLRVDIFSGPQPIEGPLVVLLSHDQGDGKYETALNQQLDTLSPRGWELLRVPNAGTIFEPKKLRELIFISHANPEDNDFARWLGANLTTLGYKVWSDVTRLIGGEEFWDDIEEAIRDHSAKVVVCLSQAAQKKKGVLDEIACAVSTERTKTLENFVVPVRIGALPFSEVRANMGRKNIIDFHGNWATGLSNLVRVFERDAVPRPIENGQGAVTLMSRLHVNEKSRLINAEDQLLANWFLITSLPTFIHFSEFTGSNQYMRRIQNALSFPTFENHRLLGSFVPADELQLSAPTSVRISHRGSIPLSDFLAGQLGDLPNMKSGVARNQVNFLLKKHWDIFAKGRGLMAFLTASKQNAWYLPHNLIPDNTVKFLDVHGNKKRRALVGWSDKRRVFWHFAVEAVPVLSDPIHFTFKAHVIFTENGRTPIISEARMHSLRRGFCKSWWNDRWRDLTAAFAAWLSSGEQHITISIAENIEIRVEPNLMILKSPVSLQADSFSEPDVGSEQFEADWLDDPELDDLEIEVLIQPLDDQNPNLEDGSNES